MQANNKQSVSSAISQSAKHHHIFLLPMDFHSLTRKELQTLCKKNKIPANITNIAMAEALTALENVEGLDEFINQSQSPEKVNPESESTAINLRSSSTRRKPINADPETPQPMTRTRRTTTRRTIIGQDQENKKNLMETPVVPASRRRATAPKEHEINNDNTIETPLFQTNGRKPSVSVQRTRHSARLLEKSLAELILKEKGRAKPVKMTDVSAASFEKTNDNQVSSLLENKGEMKDVVQQQQSKVDGQEINTQNSDYLNNHVSELIATKNDVGGETFDDLLTDKSSKVRNKMESLSVPVTEYPSEEVMELEHCLPANKVSEENSEIEIVSEEIMESTSKQIMEPEHCLHVSTAADKSSKVRNKMESLSVPVTEYPSEEVMELEHCLPANKVSEENSEIEIVSEEIMESTSKQIMETEHCLHVSTAADKSSKVRNKMESLSVPVTEYPSEEVMELEHCLPANKVSEENSEIGIVSEEIMESTSKQIMEPEHCLHVSTAAESCVEKGMMILENLMVARNNPKVDTKELIDVSLIEAEVPISNEDETPKFVKQISHPCEENIPLSTSLTEGNPNRTTKNLVDVYAMQTDVFGKQMNDGDSVSGRKFTCRNSTSPLGADPLPKQFPRTTPINSSKKQAASGKLIIVAADSKENVESREKKVESDNKENLDSSEMKVDSDNKENIDSSGMKQEFKTDKVKKNNKMDKDMMLKSLEEQSLRQLSKMLKQKLQINSQEENISKQQQVRNTRPALQSLVENSMLPGEPKQ